VARQLRILLDHVTCFPPSHAEIGKFTTNSWIAGFNLSRHPKHVCFIIYRSLGIALATGSPYTTLVMLAFQMNYFVGTVVPEIEGYMAWKYGEKWEVSRFLG